MSYGLPYCGSKSRIADKILDVLPAGNRFVDLFGGGFAMSHAALKRYPRVWYNDGDPVCVEYVRGALSGAYRGTPRWVSREKFAELKDRDPVVRYCWSFGNRGGEYCFAREIEELKHAAFNWVTLGQPFSRVGVDLSGAPPVGDWVARYAFWQARVGDAVKLQPASALKRLQLLEPLARLKRLQITCADYRDYAYSEGDVVYLDPPYQDTREYAKSGFNHAEFWHWAATFPCFISSYEAPPEFKTIACFPVRSLYSASGNSEMRYEKVFASRPAILRFF